MSLALTAAGFILLVWHRETNETSQHIWEAAVTTGMDGTGMERLDRLFKGMHYSMACKAGHSAPVWGLICDILK